MRRINWRLGTTLSLALSITLFQAIAALAQTWTGGGTDNLWTSGANWTSDPTPPVNDGTADIIYSSGSVPRTTSTVDTNYDISTLTFQTDAPSYFINQTGGSALTIEGGITNSATTTQTISAPVILGTTQSADQTWTVNSGGQLNVSGAITGNGGTFTKAGAGILQFGSAANSGFGPISITGGTLQAGTSGSLPNVDYTIGAGTLDVNGTTHTINSATLTAAPPTGTDNIVTGSGGNLTVTNQLNMGSSSTVNVNGGTATVGTLTGVSGSTLNLGSSGTFINDNGTDQTFAGSIHSSNDNSTFHLKGTNTLTLTGDNQTGFTGGKYIIDNGATLKAGAANSLSTAKHQVDGTLNANGNSFTTTGLTGASTGNVNLGAGTMTIQNTADASYDGAITGTTGAAIVTSAGNTANQTINGVISGATSITANGGTLTLAGNNTHTGGTTLNTGGTVAITQDDSTVSNLGDITKALTFNGGILQINGNTAGITPTQFNRPVNFESGGTGLDVQDSGATFTVSQNISGDHLNVNPNNGQGTVVITGNNTYGTTNITSGTLQVGNGTGVAGTLGTGDVTDNGNLVINHATSGTGSVTISNNITGSGTLRITGGQTVVLTGANALTGTTTIDANNTLKGSVGNIPGDVVANGTLDFTQATDATYFNSITGANTGAVIKDGAGTLTLSGTNNYAAASTVNAGRLDITGSTTSGTITVAAKVKGSTKLTGGTLGGNGTIVGDIVNNNIVSPGTASSPQAILNQTGNYTGNSGSSFVVSLNDDGSSSPTPGATNSELDVTGTAALNSGSKVKVDIEGRFVRGGGGAYTAIATTGGATIDPGATIETNRYFVKAAFASDDTGNDVGFTLHTDYVPRRATPNQKQLGTYLNSNSSNTNADFQAVLAALNSIPNDAAARKAVNANDIAAPMQAQTNVVSMAPLVGFSSVPEPNSIVLLMIGLAASWKVFAGKSKQQ